MALTLAQAAKPFPRQPVAWDDPRPTVNIEQACQRVGVSRRTLYNWLRAGKVDWRRTASGSVRVVEETLWAQRPDRAPAKRASA